MPERLECEVLQKARYINTLTFQLLVLDRPSTQRNYRAGSEAGGRGTYAGNV